MISSQHLAVTHRSGARSGELGLPGLVEWDLLGERTVGGEVVEAAHRIYEMLIALWAPGVIEAASDLGMFKALSERARSPQQLADELSLDAKATRVLLDALFAYRVVDRVRVPRVGGDHMYILPDAMAACLLEGGMFSIAGKIKYDRLMAWDSWRRLPETVRAGARERGEHDSVNAIPESVYESLAFGINFWAPPIVNILGRALQRCGWSDNEPRRMLDVGCGTGLYSHLLLQRFRGLVALGIDGDIMAPLASAQARRLGVKERFDALSCDFWTDDWGEEFDLVMFVNIFHLQTPGTARRLLERAAHAVGGGGVVAIVDQIIDEERGGDGPHDRFFRLFAASMLATGGGDAYAITTYSQWLADAGFAVECLEDAPMHRVLLARRDIDRQKAQRRLSDTRHGAQP